MKKVCILVLGAHRSGTSAITRTLNLLGADLPANLLDPQADNPTGFWESRDHMLVNDELLARLELSWDSPLRARWNLLDSAAFERFRDRIVELLHRDFDGSQLFALKDPRLCRLLPIWKSALEQFDAEPKCILIVRHPLEVAASLATRNKFPLQTSLLIWLRYAVEVEYETRGLNRIFVSYNQLLSDWRATVQRIVQTLNLEWPRRDKNAAHSIDEFLRKNLRHVAIIEPTDNGHQSLSLTPTVRREFVAFCSAVQGETSQTAEMFENIRLTLIETDSIADPLFSDVSALRNEILGLRADVATLRQDLTDRDARLTEAHRALGRLGATVEALRKSISWRATAPLRELLRSADRLRRVLWPRSYQFELRPAAQLRSVNPARNLWQAQGPDPQFLLIPKSGRNPTRWCDVLIGIKGLDGGQRPVLRANDGGGFAESCTLTLPPPTNGEARAVIELPRFTCALRLDPCQGPGRFEINRVVIREISRTKAKQLERLFDGRASAASVARHLSADRDAHGFGETSAAGQLSAQGGTPGPEAKALVRERLKAELAAFLASGAELVLPRPQSPLASITLVLYNHAELTFNCLCSIVAHAGQNSEVIIIDNASTDATAELLKRVHGAVVVLNAENRYFPPACNQASDHARGKYLLLINNDAQLLPGSLQAAVDVLEEDENVGAVGGRILTLTGSLQEAGSIVWSDGSTLGYGRGDVCDRPQYMFRREVDFCSGAFLLTPTRLFRETGGFDEVFSPGYYEEVDFCLRLWKQGFRVVYEPRAAIVHFEYGSSDSAFASSVMTRNRQIICSRHADYLARREPPDRNNELRARYARLRRPRILFIDDRIPHLDQGSGYPRANAIANGMMRMGATVTLFPTTRSEEPWQQVYRDLPREIEVMADASADSLDAFLQQRRGEYDAIFVSRPHNMRRLLSVLGDKSLLNGCRLIYDAEAVFALRSHERARVLGDGDPEATQHELAEELELAAKADQIVCVSEAERRHFVKRGLGPAYILGHSLEATPSTTAFENRYDILFVGARHGPDSPNEDSVLWFARNVLPLVCARLASEDVRLLVIGQNTVQRLSALAGDPSIELLGSVKDLSPYYNRARIFVAPTRFAADIPIKILEAAARGVPTVATALIAAELGWTDGEELLTAPATDPEKFADQCVRLYRDRELWSRLRQQALLRVNRDCSPAYFADALETIFTQPGQGAGATDHSTHFPENGETRNFQLIREDGDFDPDFFLYPFAPRLSRDDAIRSFLREWTEGTVGRKPCSGFNPYIYAADSLVETELATRNPFAHFIEKGKPRGRWLTPLIQPSCTPVGPTTLRVALHLHAYYPDLIDEFLNCFEPNQSRCDLFVSTARQDELEWLQERLHRYANGKAHCSVVPNRGRNLGPFLTAYKSLTASYDLIGHFHCKKSPEGTKEFGKEFGDTWRQFLWRGLLGPDHPMLDTIAHHFQDDPRLGLVFPDDPHLVGWRNNKELAASLAARMGINNRLPDAFEFPVGSMFWCRPEALRPLFALNLSWDEYPEEPLPNDGTLLHAIERLLPFVAEHEGYHFAAGRITDIRGRIPGLTTR